MNLTYASVAQLVEQRTENPRVTGSIPVGGTKKEFSRNGDIPGESFQRILHSMKYPQVGDGKSPSYAGIAHLVERHLAKVEVASSSLVARSNAKRNLFCSISGLKGGRRFHIHRFLLPLPKQNCSAASLGAPEGPSAT